MLYNLPASPKLPSKLAPNIGHQHHLPPVLASISLPIHLLPSVLHRHRHRCEHEREHEHLNVEPEVVNLNPPVLGKLRHGLRHRLLNQGANLQPLGAVPGDEPRYVQQTAATDVNINDFPDKFAGYGFYRFPNLPA